MAKNLVIVESPAKAKTIKKYLGRNYEVTASMGHLRDLPKSQLGVDIENGFEPKYIAIRGKGDLINSLKKEAKSASKVFLATDPDREGEAISWHLAQILDIDTDSKCRIKFNEITETALKNAVKQPEVIDMNLVNAQQARRILDRIVGYKLSPLLWKKVKKGLSAGRVQSAVTAIIVDREKEIENFKTEEYWTISVDLSKIGAKQTFSARFYGTAGKKVNIKSKEQADEILAKLNDSDFIVKNVKLGKKTKTPAPPFTTSTMQQEASRRLNFTSKRTMAAAQALYEGVDVKGYGTVGLITYMRTDSLRISTEAMQSARGFIASKYGNEYIPSTPRVYKSKSSAQDAHEAIRPTDVTITPDAVRDSVSADQYKLYKLIWDRFISSQMSSAVYNTLSTEIEAMGNIFRAAFSKQEFAGFECVYATVNDEEDEIINKTLPSILEGEKLACHKINPNQCFTEPPARYTEGSLIKAMEEKGIGRPSTYAPTITLITTRGYVEREKKTLKPTPLGVVVTELMKEHFTNIVDVEFTAEMEQELDVIEDGNVEWKNVLDKFYEPFSKLLSDAESVISKVKVADEESDEICEKCGRTMVYKMGRYGKFLACPGFPECRNTKAIIKETGVTCPKCGGKIIERKSQKGKKYFVCENNPKCDTILWDMPIQENCPVCGSLMSIKIFRGRKVKSCSNRDCGKSESNE